MMKAIIIISIFLPAYIYATCTVRDAKSYDQWVSNAKGFVSQSKDFVIKLGNKYNPNKDVIDWQIYKLDFSEKEFLEDLKVCLHKWYTVLRGSNRLCEKEDLENCWRKYEDAFHKTVDFAKKEAEILFNYEGWVRKVDISISKSEDFIKKLGNKYNLTEDDMAPKMNELFFLKRQFLENLEGCLKPWKPYYTSFHVYSESLNKDGVDQCLKLVDSTDPIHKAVDIVTRGVEPLFVYTRWVSNVHIFISESKDFIRKLNNKYIITENKMASKMRELSFLERQVLEDFKGCLNLWFTDNSGAGFKNQLQLEQCLQRVENPFHNVVDVVRNEAEFSFNSDCAYVYNIKWMNNFVASCADPLIRQSINRRAIDCVYLEISDFVMDSIEEQVLNKTLPQKITICHRHKFSDLLPKLFHWKTMLWSNLRSTAIKALEDISSQNNKCSTKEIVGELTKLHSGNKGLVSDLYDYIQSQKREYEKC